MFMGNPLEDQNSVEVTSKGSSSERTQIATHERDGNADADQIDFSRINQLFRG